VLDWEHLPALHKIYFDRVALVESGSWGWRVELTKAPGTLDRPMLLELRIDRKACYLVRTLAGDSIGTKIWTLLEAHGARRTAVEVRFTCPSIVRRGSRPSARNTGRCTRVSGSRTRR
jgi:hypothetical protein